MRAEKIGRDTMLSRIVQLVAEAQRSRAPIQRMADQVSAWFVPTVIAIAIAFRGMGNLGTGTATFSYGLVAAVAVLIIACPCALGLATPMSIMVGVGRGAQMGVLIKNAEALEHMEKVDTIVIDKTGTLTRANQQLPRLLPRPGSLNWMFCGLLQALNALASTRLPLPLFEPPRNVVCHLVRSQNSTPLRARERSERSMESGLSLAMRNSSPNLALMLAL